MTDSTAWGKLYHQWWPLALSFAMMMVEGPSLQAAIGRLPDRELNLAAWGLTMSLSLLVESPVIMLLATSIALVRNRAGFGALRGFVVGLCVALTGLTALVAFTPLYTWVTLLVMRQPSPIVAAARPALQVMLFWTAAIGWRRFCQGVLVRHGHTRFVSWGTAIRLISMATAAIVLVLDGRRTGVVTAATAIMTGVVAEALASTWFLRPVLTEEVPDNDSPAPQLSAILHFHLPLALTSLLALMAGPLESSALARLPNAQQNLASWPVAFLLVLVLRSGCFAMQEITVAQAHEPETGPVLGRFALRVGLVSSALVLLLCLTPLLPFYLEHAINMPRELWDGVRLGALLSAGIPLLTALSSHRRGLCMVAGRTPLVYQGVAISLLAHGLFLWIGVRGDWIPMVVAAGGITTSALVEFAWLTLRSRRLLTY